MGGSTGNPAVDHAVLTVDDVPGRADVGKQSTVTRRKFRRRRARGPRIVERHPLHPDVPPFHATE